MRAALSGAAFFVLVANALGVGMSVGGCVVRAFGPALVVGVFLMVVSAAGVSSFGPLATWTLLGCVLGSILLVAGGDA